MQEMTPGIDPVGAVDPRPALPARPDPTPAPQPASPKADASARQPAPYVKLTIGLAPSGDFYVYTLTDTATGRVLVQLPRDQLEGLKQRGDYTAGAVVRTRA